MNSCLLQSCSSQCLTCAWGLRGSYRIGKVSKPEKMSVIFYLKTFTGLLMHVAIATISAICIGKGKHIIVKKTKTRLEVRGVNTLWPPACVYWMLYICLFIEGRMICKHLNPRHERVDWQISYLLIWKCVHTVSYVIHTVASSTCCFSQPCCWCQNVHISFALYFVCFFFPCIWAEDFLHVLTVPSSPTNPVITVHPLNPALFYFVTCQWPSLMTLEAVARCVSFNPAGTHRRLVTTPPVHMCKYCM